VSRARWWAPATAIVAMGVVVAVGSAVPAPPSAAQLPEPTRQLLTGATQVCPSALAAVEADAQVSAVALPAPSLPDIDVAGDPELALLPLDGVPSPRTVLESTDLRGQTVTSSAQQPLLVRASGDLAPALVAESTVTAAGERSSGLAGQPCLEPAREWWFAAGSGAVGRRATLVLANPSDATAVVDVEIWTESGPLLAAGTSDLGIPPAGTRTVALDAIALGRDRTAVRVTAVVGRVSAAVLLREIDGADPVGLSWATPSQPPALRSYVPGLPAFGDRRLRLLNPGEEDAIVRLRALAGQGPFTPVGLEAIDVPAGRVVDVDLAPAGEEAFALEVDSTTPVVSAVEVRQTPRSGLGDLAVVGSADTLHPVAASWLTTDERRSSRVVLTALPAGDEDEQRADEGEQPSPTPQPTSSPTSTSEGETLLDIDTPTTQVVVKVLGVDGAVLRADVATLALGTTDTFPVDLPDGVDEGWMTVEPVEPELVLAVRETTTTVRIPDPLDPDTTRSAFWLDLVALSSVRVDVEVPAVVADISTGLGGSRG
jgi:hypothetical protein